jgi:glucokinase
VGFYIIGTDLGGTKIATALTDTDSQILKYETSATDPRRPAEAIIGEMAESILKIAEGIPREAVLGVGVACAGLITREGVVAYSPNLDWHSVPLKELLEARLPWKVYLHNDVNLAAVGELHYGAAQGKQQVVCMFVGTGIGGGLIVNGKLYTGAQGYAAEIGHMSIDWEGPSDFCGNPGCIEVLASGTAMARRAREAISAGRSSMILELAGGTPEHIRVETLVEALQRGDTLAQELVQTTGTFLGAALVNLVNLINPERIVMGGGVIRGLPQLVDIAREHVFRYALKPPLEGLEIVLAQFGREAPVIGATVLVKMAGEI